MTGFIKPVGSGDGWGCENIGCPATAVGPLGDVDPAGGSAGSVGFLCFLCVLCFFDILDFLKDDAAKPRVTSRLEFRSPNLQSCECSLEVA
jgi:hypothetical protein